MKSDHSQSVIRGYDLSLLHLAIRDPAMFPPGQRHVAPNLAAEIALLHEIQKTKGACPGYMFDRVVNWAAQWISPDPKHSLYQEFRSKLVVIIQVHDFAFSKETKPQKKRVILPHVQCPVDVSVFPFVPTIYDLLTNPQLDSDENYLFGGITPLQSPDPRPRWVNDVETSRRFIDCWEFLKKDPIDLPLGLGFFIDSATVAGNERLTIEAVMCQLKTLHRRTTRYKSISFRNLGIIPRKDHLPYPKSNSGAMKIADYHVLLDVILEQCRQAMSHNGLLWVIRHKNVLYRVNIKLYLYDIVGDTPGHNKICGKFDSAFTKLQCRYCLCPSDKLQDPTKSYRRVTRRECTCANNSAKRMKEKFSMFLISNAIEKLQLGPCPYGVIGLCPQEIIHVLMLGSHNRLHEGIVTMLRCADFVALYERRLFCQRIANGWYRNNGGYATVGEADVSSDNESESEIDNHEESDESDNSDEDNSSTINTHEKQVVVFDISDKSDSSDDSGDNNSSTSSSSVLEEVQNQVQDVHKADDASYLVALNNDGEDSDDHCESESESESEEEDDDSHLDFVGELVFPGIIPGKFVPEDNGPTSLNISSKKKTKVFSGLTGARVDSISRVLGRLLRHQADRDMPQLTHTKGIINKAKSTAGEQQGILLMMNIILCSTHGKKSLEKLIGAERMAFTIECIESFLCLEEFAKDIRGFPHNMIAKMKTEITSAKQMFRFVVSRTEGNSMNVVKFHLLDHMANDCHTFGSPANISGGPGETNQKTNKAAARRTQLNVETFDYQQSVRLCESYAVERAASQVNAIYDHVGAPNEEKDVGISSEIDYTPTCTNKKYKLQVDARGNVSMVYIGSKYTPKGLKYQGNHHKHDPICLFEKNDITRSIKRCFKKICEHRRVRSAELEIFTELRLWHDSQWYDVKQLEESDLWEKCLYRADPVYTILPNMDMTPRSDWGVFLWKVAGSRQASHIPGRMLCFMKACKPFRTMFGPSYTEGKIFCMAESLCKEPSTYLDMGQDLNISDMQHPASRIVFKGTLERTKEQKRYPEVHICPVDMVVGPAIVFADFHPAFHKTRENKKGAVIHKWADKDIDRMMSFIVIRPRRQWSHLFQAVSRNTFGKQNMVKPDFGPYLQNVSNLHQKVKTAKAQARVLKRNQKNDAGTEQFVSHTNPKKRSRQT
jgi:hypothetical protein